MSAISPPKCRLCQKEHWTRDNCAGRPHIPEAHELRAPKRKKPKSRKRKAKA